VLVGGTGVKVGGILVGMGRGVAVDVYVDVDVRVGDLVGIGVLLATGFKLDSSIASECVAVMNITWVAGAAGGLPRLNNHIPRTMTAHNPRKAAPPPRTASAHPILLVFFFGLVCEGMFAVIGGLGKLVNVWGFWLTGTVFPSAE